MMIESISSKQVGGQVVGTSVVGGTVVGDVVVAITLLSNLLKLARIQVHEIQTQSQLGLQLG